MKKIILLITVLSVILSVAAENPERIILGTGNDVLTLGLSRNTDDQLSFSLNAAVIFGVKQIVIDYESITNRGWRQGWSVFDDKAEGMPDSWFSGRYDELRISGTHEFKFNQNFSVIKIKPGIGIDVSGNLGGQFLQNTLHSVINLHKANIPYDQKTVLCPLISFDSSIEFSIGQLVLKPIIQTRIVPVLRATQSVLIGASYYSLDFSFGYKFIQCRSSSDSEKMTSEELCAEYQRGPVFNLSFDGGFIVGKYTTSFLTGCGFGQVGFDVTALFEKRKTDSPLKYKLGTKKGLGKSYRLFEIVFPLKNGIEFILSDYTVGRLLIENPKEPVFVAEGSGGNLGTRYIWNNAFYMVGIKTENNGRRISPYISVLAGCFKTDETAFYNTVSDPKPFNGEIIRSFTWSKNLSACAEFRTGIEIRLFRNLGLDLFAGIHGLVFSENKDITPFFGISLITE